jgi:hypothetical protein
MATTKDIDETRDLHKKMKEVEVVVGKITDALAGQSAYIAIGALTSYLGRLLYKTETSVESIAMGLRTVVAMCDDQVNRDTEAN